MGRIDKFVEQFLVKEIDKDNGGMDLGIFGGRKYKKKDE